MRRRFTSSMTFRLLMTWLALSLASFAWAAATPLGASPDEPAHIIKAASVAHGQFIGEPTTAPAVTKVQVPAGLAQAGAWPCYAFHPHVSAGCMFEPTDGLAMTDATTSAGLYDPVYYALVGWPSTFIADSTAAVLAMRAVSGILVSFFLAFVYIGLLTLTRPLIAGLAFFAALTPMVLFLSSAVNPNALEIGAGAALLVGLLWAAGARSTAADAAPPRAVLVVVAVAGILLANARGISPLWMALIAVIVFIAVPWERLKYLLSTWRVRITVIALALGVAGAGAWLLATGTLGAMGTFPGAGKVGPLEAFVVMLVARSADPGLIGVFGWLDTAAPALVYVIWCVLLGGIALVAVLVSRGRELRVTLVAAGIFLLGPAVVQALSVRNSGYIWQGRYSIILLVCAVIVAAIAIERSIAELPAESMVVRRGVPIIAALVLLGQLYAFVGTMARYAGGSQASMLKPFTSPEWAPPGGAVVWTALLVASLAVPLFFWLTDVRREAIRTERIPV